MARQLQFLRDEWTRGEPKGFAIYFSTLRFTFFQKAPEGIERDSLTTERGSCFMKTSYTKFALAASSLLVAACGGSGGGGGTTPFLNLTADQIAWVEPAKLDAGSMVQNFCRYGNFRVKVNSKEACSTYQDPNTYLKLFSASNFRTTAFKQASATLNTGPDECTIMFKANEPLLPQHSYILTIADAPPGSPGLTQDSVLFQTGDLLNQACGTGEDFIATQIRVGQAGTALPDPIYVNSSFISAPEGNVTVDWNALEGLGGDFFDYIGSTLQSLLGFSGVGTNPQLQISFNDDVEDFSVRNGIALFRVPDLGQGGLLGQSERIPLDSGCPAGLPYNDHSCVIFDGDARNRLIVNLPGALSNNTQYLIVIGQSMVSAGGKNLHSSYGYIFNTGH